MDTYVILLLAIVLLIFHMKEFGEHQHASQYFLPHRELRLSYGVTLTLFHLMNGLLLFVPFAFIYLYDYTGGAAVALTGAAVLLVASRRIEHLSAEIAIEESMQAFLRRFFTAKGLVSISVLRILACSEGLVLNVLFACFLLKGMFGVPPMMTGSLLMFFAFIYAGMGGIVGIRKVGFWLFLFIFAALTLIPAAAFLLKGISPTRLQLQGMNVLETHTGSLAMGCTVFALVFLGRLMLHLLTYPEFSLVNKKRIRIAYQLTTVCWSALPLSVSAIVFYFLSFPSMATLFHGSLSVFLEAVPRNLAWAVMYVFMFFILSAFALGIGMSLHGILITLRSSFPSFSRVKHIYAAAMFLCCVPLFIIPFGQPALKAAIGFYIHLLAASGMPLYEMWNSKKQSGIAFTGGILISTIIGCVVAWYTGWLMGSLCCVILSYTSFRLNRLINVKNI